MVAHTYVPAPPSSSDEMTTLCLHGFCLGIRTKEFDDMSTSYMLTLCSLVILALVLCTLVAVLTYSLVQVLIETLPRNMEKRQVSTCVYSTLARSSPLHTCSKTMDNGCAICLDVMSIGSIVRRLPCKHTFHAECIDEWLLCGAKVAQCPLCMSLLSEKCTSEDDAESVMAGCV